MITKKEYFKIEGDKLEADFTWKYLGDGKVQFDATPSKGMFIDWSVCTWNFGEDSDQKSINWQETTSNGGGLDYHNSGSIGFSCFFQFGKELSGGGQTSTGNSSTDGAGLQNRKPGGLD